MLSIYIISKHNSYMKLSFTSIFLCKIRLKQGMFNDHMPYSYTAVFTGGATTYKLIKKFSS